ncbi:MAG: DUF2442 domain-containing protein [Pyrinomonadaceae bacterium]
MDELEFERQFAEATARGEASLATLPKADSASYDSANAEVVIKLRNGAKLVIPTKLIQGLQTEDESALGDIELFLDGTEIHWPTLDVQMYVKSLINGVFGTPRWIEQLKQHYSTIGAKGGSIKSARKSESSRANGRKGGRPRKVPSA